MSKKHLVVCLDKKQENQLKVICKHLEINMDEFVAKAIEELVSKVFAKEEQLTIL